MNMTDQDILIPDPLASNEQYQRFYCLDIGGLADMELGDELNYLRARLWELPEGHWARERVHLLIDEINHRGNSEYTLSKQPKTKVACEVKL